MNDALLAALYTVWLAILAFIAFGIFLAAHGSEFKVLKHGDIDGEWGLAVMGTNNRPQTCVAGSTYQKLGTSMMFSMSPSWKGHWQFVLSNKRWPTKNDARYKMVMQFDSHPAQAIQVFGMEGGFRVLSNDLGPAGLLIRLRDSGRVKITVGSVDLGTYSLRGSANALRTLAACFENVLVPSMQRPDAAFQPLRYGVRS